MKDVLIVHRGNYKVSLKPVLDQMVVGCGDPACAVHPPGGRANFALGGECSCIGWMDPHLRPAVRNYLYQRRVDGHTREREQ